MSKSIPNDKQSLGEESILHRPLTVPRHVWKVQQFLPRFWWLLPVPLLLWRAGLVGPVLMTGAAVNHFTDTSHSGWELLTTWVGEGGIGLMFGGTFLIAGLAFAGGVLALLGSQCRRRAAGETIAALLLALALCNFAACVLMVGAVVLLMVLSFASMGVAGPEEGLLWLLLGSASLATLLLLNVRHRALPKPAPQEARIARLGPAGGGP